MKGPATALLVLGVLIGIAFGVATYTFIYARGYSYLSNDPAACANCHVMNEQYDGWLKGSHKAVAACNDCHTPPGIVGKYATKASNGFWHSFYFTTGTFHDPIQIKARNRDVLEQACRQCHSTIVSAIEGHQAAGEISCTRCHNDVGHLELSTVGQAVPSRKDHGRSSH